MRKPPLYEVAPSLKQFYHRSNEVRFEELSSGSAIERLWTCSDGHEVLANPIKMLNVKAWCSVCSCRQIIEGINDLFATHPELERYWSPRNTLDPKKLSRRSSVKVFWSCPLCGGDYKSEVRNRVLGKECPSCAGLKISNSRRVVSLAKSPNLQEAFPKVAEEWHPTLNLGLFPSDLTYGSRRKVWWLCKDCENAWQVAVCSRTKKVGPTGCPLCANARTNHSRIARLLESEKSAFDVAPGLQDELSPKEYVSLKGLLPSSNKELLWTCEEGHEWTAPLYTRIRGFGNCPYCHNRKFLKGFNDLLSLFPEIALEYSKTNTTPLKEVIAASGRKYLWTCSECSCEWTTSPKARTVLEAGCPSCRRRCSYLERIVHKALRKFYDGEILVNKRPIKSPQGLMELDIWLPELNIAFEVQDFATHSKVSDCEQILFYQNQLKKGPKYHELKRTLAFKQLSTVVVDLWEDTVRDPRLLEAAVREAILSSL